MLVLHFGRISPKAFLRLYLFFLPTNVRRSWGKSSASTVAGGKTLARVAIPVSRLRVVVYGRGNRSADRRGLRRQADKAREELKHEGRRWRLRKGVEGLGELPT